MSDGGKYYDLDARLSDAERPRIKFRGREYFVADLSAKDILLFTRRVQTRQEILALREEDYEEEIQEAIACGEDINLEQVDKKREEFADKLQEIFSEAASTILSEIVKTDNGEDKLDDEGRVVTKPMDESVANSLTQREWMMLQETLAEINGALPREDEEGNLMRSAT